MCPKGGVMDYLAPAIEKRELVIGLLKNDPPGCLQDNPPIHNPNCDGGPGPGPLSGQE
jgi:hypothetical protein